MRDKRDWPNEEHWVAARIDLGHERYSDPIRAARDEADALVHLAAFHNGRTGWRPFQGHLHIVDDVLRSSSGPFEDPVNRDNWIALDHTDEALHDLHDDLEPHLPVDDPALHELINAAAVLNTAASSDDSAGLLQSVRIIELIATRCDIRWQTFLTDYLATAGRRPRSTTTSTDPSLTSTTTTSSESTSQNSMPSTADSSVTTAATPGA